jgi:Sporulation and spore germination
MKRLLQSIVRFLRNTGEKIQNTHPAVQIIAFSVLMGIFFLVMVSLFFRHNTDRAIFYFPGNRAESIRTEIRYLPKVPGIQERLNQYVSELLLGPISPEFIPLYPKDVKILRCFVRGKTAYIDISSKALEKSSEYITYIEAFELFKKNVFTNFRNLDKIYMYIDGVEIYSGDPVADAEQKIKKR